MSLFVCRAEARCTDIDCPERKPHKFVMNNCDKPCYRNSTIAVDDSMCEEVEEETK
jgi:hypothetical protein